MQIKGYVFAFATAVSRLPISPLIAINTTTKIREATRVMTNVSVLPKLEPASKTAERFRYLWLYGRSHC